MKNKTIRSNKMLSILPAICIMMGIFYFSSQTADISSGLSEGVVSNLFETLKTDVKAGTFKIIETLIRKGAHMTEYAVLSLAVCLPFFVYRIAQEKLVLYSGLVCVIYAMTDELHQIFVPGRAGRITDVLIDTCGVLIGCFIFIRLTAELLKENS